MMLPVRLAGSTFTWSVDRMPAQAANVTRSTIQPGSGRKPPDNLVFVFGHPHQGIA